VTTSHRGASSNPESLPSAKALWESLLEPLRERVGPALTQRWLEGLEPRLEGDSLLLGAQTAFTSEWIERNFLPEIRLLAKDHFAIAEVRVSIRPPRPSEDPSGSPPARGDAGVGGGPRDENPPPAPSRSVRPVAPAPLRETSPELTLGRFVVGPCNRVAYHAAVGEVRARGASYNPLFVYGGCGVGKTHLLQGLTREAYAQGEQQIRYLPAEGFVNRFGAAVRTREIERFRERFRRLDLFVLDDVQIMAGKPKCQLELLETIDVISSAGGRVVLASDCRPAELDGLVEKLLGRFRAGLVCRMSEPSVATRYQILRGEAQRSALTVRPEVLQHIAERSLGNVRELLGGWRRIVAESALLGAPLTVGHVDGLLAEQEERGGRLSVDRIVEEVGRRYGVPPEEFPGRSRSRTIALARQIAIYLARELTPFSLVEIGERFGGRSHGTVGAAIRKIDQARRKDEAFRREIESLIHRLRG